MKKQIVGYKLSREKDTRKALYRSLTRALVKHGKIKTTHVKAKFLQKHVEKIINMAKKDDTASRRRVYAFLGNDKQTAKLIFSEVKKLFKSTNGGYTRLIKLPNRKGDNAKMAQITWSKDFPPEPKTKSKKVSKSKKESPTQKLKSNLSKISKNKK